MSSQSFDKKIQALEALRADPAAPRTVAALRKALGDRSSFVVAKSAALTADLELSGLAPDLVSAFERLLAAVAKADPQCRAKSAIAKALGELGHQDPAVFLQGLAHVQAEPVWGGQQDSAAVLRATCAGALVQCRALSDLEILGHLVDLLADPEKTARIAAAQAIAQISRPESALLLRLKVRCGDRDPEVVGECFAALLTLAPEDAVAVVAGFLDAPDRDLRFEAVAALGESRTPQAFEALRACWRREVIDGAFKNAVLVSIGASRQPRAVEFLLSLVASESTGVAAKAIVALAPNRFYRETYCQVRDAVRRLGSSALQKTFLRNRYFFLPFIFSQHN